MVYSINNKTTQKEVDIYIYDEVGSFDVNAKKFIDDLKGLKGKTLNIHINSLGGEVFDGMAIANAIKSHDGATNSFIEGICASISTVIALASDKVYMSENSLFMIHNAWGGSMGEAKDLRKQADILEKISNEIANVYRRKTDISYDNIISMMEEETWMTAQESMEMGFVDEITEAMKMVAKYDVSKFKNITNEKIQSIINNKIKENKMENSEKSIIDKLKNIFAETEVSETPKNAEKYEEKMEEPAESGDLDAMKDAFDGLVQRVQNLEDAIADLKADKEEAKAELTETVGQLETANDTIVAMGKEMAKLGAKSSNVTPDSDPAIVKKEVVEDSNSRSFNALAERLKNKYIK